jgi:SdrD B-like domain/Carboxypeptidase regulatory-like domain
MVSPTSASEPALAPATSSSPPSGASTASEDGSLGDFGGVIFTDLNDNGVADPGETGLAGVAIEIDGGRADLRYQQTTDAQGRFSFPGIPTGIYYLNYTAPHPWLVRGITGDPYDYVYISDSPQYSDIWIPAVRSLQESLRVSLFFDRDVYRADETAQLTVVLVNSGDSAITGVTAACFPGEDMPNLRGGPGWGPLADGGPGVTVPAGEVRFVAVSEPVPPAAPRFGYVTAMCDFGAPGYQASVNAHATAKVPGLPGAGHARMFHDIDDDYHFDDGEAVAGVTVVITDPDTGAAVARLTTDPSGAFAVDNLPATVYDVRIDGPWKPRTDIFGFQLPVVAGPWWSGDPWLSVVPASAEENRRPNLQASAAFEKPVYKSDEKIRVRLTVTNIGEGAAEGVRVGLDSRGPALPVLPQDLKEMTYFGPGTRIEAGATKVIEIEATVWNPPGTFVFSGWVYAAGYDINFSNNGFGAIVAVIATRGTYAGVLYGDRNGNGVMDPGEAFAQTPIDLSGGMPNGRFNQSTDAQGRFAFRDIPTGRYYANYFIPNGWLIQHAEVVVKEGEQPEVQVRAVRLETAIEFTKDTYVVGEIAHLKITLTNPGATDLTGITALCTGSGMPYEIYSFGPGWGAIAENGPGVVVRAGETAIFDVWTVIPEGGLEYGFVSVYCVFGAPSSYGTNPSAWDKARVPGGIGSVGGLLLYDRNSDGDYEGDGVADTKIVLMDEFTGQAVARAVTDPQGHFMFRNVPAGRYQALVVGPWKIAKCWSPGQNACLGVLAGKERDIDEVRVVPGAIQSDPDAPQGEPNSPQDESDSPQDEPQPIPQGTAGTAERLATTGAGVLGLLIGGLTMLAAGLGMVLIRKRRLHDRHP